MLKTYGFFKEKSDEELKEILEELDTITEEDTYPSYFYEVVFNTKYFNRLTFGKYTQSGLLYKHKLLLEDLKNEVIERYMEK